MEISFSQEILFIKKDRWWTQPQNKYLCSGFLIEKGVWRSHQFARPSREKGIK
jgi:hypothetical protein